MEKRLIQLKEAIHYRTAYFKQRVVYHVKRIGFRIFIIGVALSYVNRNDLSFNLELNALKEWAPYFEEQTTMVAIADEQPKAMNTSMFNSPEKTEIQKKSKAPTNRPKDKPKTEDNLANTYSNLTYSGKGIATKDTKTDEQIKREKQLKYVDRFAVVAQKEMEKFGIPASITLAQGLLESNAGESPLAVKNNNHFGIKCFSRSCKKGHCSNFTDDSHKDFFRKYNNAWESFRGHSYLLSADRYKPLYKLSSNDYIGWAKGLKKAGYATDKHYAEKLINLIEELDLHQYDE